MNTLKTRLALVMASLPSIAMAQQNPASDWETISVIGSKTPIQRSQVPGFSTVFGPEEIQASGAVSIADLIRGTAGISISQSGAKGTLTELRVRGSESNHILVLVDGVEVNDLGQDGVADLSRFNLDNVARVEILRGPQSTLWGNGAVGGVISITTKTATSDGTSGQLSAEVGNNSTQNLSAQVQGQSSNINYGASVSYSSTDGQNIALVGDEDDGYDRTELTGRLKWQASKRSSISANLRYIDADNDFDAVDFFTTGLPIDANNETVAEQLSGQISWDYNPGGIWSQQLTYQITDNDNQSTNDGVVSGENNSKKQRLFWLNRLNYAEDGRLNLALEYVKEDFSQRGPNVFGDPNQDQENDVNSLIVDWQQGFGQTHVSFSGRYDNNDIFENANSYRVGVSHAIGQGHRVYVSYGQAVKNPTFVERFGFIPSSFQGNADLDPEQSVSWEIGADWQINADWLAQISWYNTDLEDEINGFVFDPVTSAFTADNVPGDSEREGIDLSLQGSLLGWQISGSYGYLDAKQPDPAGELQNELRRARHTASLTGQYQWQSVPVSLYLQAAYQGTREDNFFPPFPEPSRIEQLGAHTLINMSVSYQVNDDWRVQVRADNLFDHDYQDVFGFRGQERLYYLGVDYLL